MNKLMDEDVYNNPVASFKEIKKKLLTTLATETDDEIEKTCTRQKSACTNKKKTRTMQKSQEAMCVSDPPPRKGTRRNKHNHTSCRELTDSNNRESPIDLTGDFEIPPVVTTITNEKRDVYIDDKNYAYQEENYDIRVKVLWQSKDMILFNMKRLETFSKVFQYFADTEHIPINKILIIKDNKYTVKMTDTPASLNLTVIDILEGGIINTVEEETQDSSEKENTCNVKVQMGGKKSLNFLVKKDEPFHNLLYQCSQELQIDKQKIKFYFDGEVIGPDETPNDLEFEDEACIDLIVSKK